MNLLFILCQLPYPMHRNGITLIDYRLLARAPQDANIDLICAEMPAARDIEALKQAAPALRGVFCVEDAASRTSRLLNLLSVFFCGRVFAKNGALLQTLQRCIAAKSYDAIYASPYPMIFELAGLKTLPPLFLNAVDAYSLLCRSIYRRERKLYPKFKEILYRSNERKLLKYARCVNFVSSKDADYTRRTTRHPNVQNITLGIDGDMFFRNASIPKEANTLLFSGNFSYKPNADTAQYIAQELFPAISAARPDARLYIAGKNPPTLAAHKNITVTGFVESIAEWYNRAEIFVCPLLYGAGIKNKMLEAMACGLPAVASSVAVSGIAGLQSGVHFLLADSKAEQIAAIEKLLADSALRDTLSRSAVSFIAENYNWDRQVGMYYKMLAMMGK